MLEDWLECRLDGQSEGQSVMSTRWSFRGLIGRPVCELARGSVRVRGSLGGSVGESVVWYTLYTAVTIFWCCRERIGKCCGTGIENTRPWVGVILLFLYPPDWEPVGELGGGLLYLFVFQSSFIFSSLSSVSLDFQVLGFSSVLFSFLVLSVLQIRRGFS